jgi:hypothetical protein
MEITKKIKKSLEDYELNIVSENPLTLSSKDGEEFTGLCAELKIKDILSDEDESEDLSLNDLKNLDDDDYLLVTASANYADEFDLSEWRTMTAVDFKEIVKGLKAHKDEISWYFGSNEELTFEDGKDLLSCFSFRKISEVEFNTLDNLFGGGFDGGGSIFDHVYVSEGEDEDEDDSFFGREELTLIKKAEKKGWKVEIVDEEEYLIKVTNDNGDNATTRVWFLEALIKG